MLAGALTGMRIVEVGESVAASFCGKVLADLGAKVIGVEPPEGSSTRRMPPLSRESPEFSGLFGYLQAGKDGVTLNLGNNEALPIFLELLEHADCLVLGRADPRALPAINPVQLAERFPNLLVVAVTPFGLSGEYSGVPGTEMTVQAVSGLLGVTPKFPTGTDREPLKLPGHIGSSLAGLHAVAAVLAALLTGQRGVCLDVSEVDAQMACYTPVFSQYEANPALQFTHQTPTTGWYITNCRDGYVLISALMDEPWERLKDAIGRPEWADSPAFHSTADRVQNFDALRLALQPWLDQHDRADLLERFQRRGGTSCPVYTVPEAVQSEQLAYRKFFTPMNVEKFGNAVLMPGSGFAGGQGTPPRRAPMLGEHNGEVFVDLLEISRDRMDQLKARGVI